MGYDGCYSLHQLYHNLIKKLLVGWFGQLLRKSMSQGWVANTLLAVVYDCAICLLRVEKIYLHIKYMYVMGIYPGSIF